MESWKLHLRYLRYLRSKKMYFLFVKMKNSLIFALAK